MTSRKTLTQRLLTSLALIGLAAPGAALAVSPDETDARAIMQAVEDREDGDKTVSRMTMVLKDKDGRERKRSVQSRSMDFKAGSKSILLFEGPADVRNTGLLSIDYDDGAKDDDQWLYLPSLNKSTRISGSDKSGAFLGSDLTFADMTSRDLDDYEYKILEQSAKVGDEEVWVIESRPKTKKAKDETGYLKSKLWVSKSKLMPLQIKNWIIEGKKIKLMKFSNIKQIDGIWTPHKLKVWTKKKKETLSTTVLSWKSFKYNDASVKDSDFSQRALEKGVR